jgi:hypothetical protein
MYYIKVTLSLCSIKHRNIKKYRAVEAPDGAGEWSVSYSSPSNLEESPQHPVDRLGSV